MTYYSLLRVTESKNKSMGFFSTLTKLIGILISESDSSSCDFLKKRNKVNVSISKLFIRTCPL